VKRITPRHLQLAIRGDEELDTLIKVRKTTACTPGGISPSAPRPRATEHTTALFARRLPSGAVV